MGRQHQKTHREEDTGMVHECTDIPLLCPKCKSLIAFIDKETSSEIRIKYRDLFIYCVDPLAFSTPCRSCGNVVHINRKEDVVE